MSTRESRRLFRFGLFEADLDNARLTHKGVRVRLQHQPFRVLAMLLEHSGQIVTREELRQELWPAGTYVSFDASLNMALKRLRSALGDDADNPRFIETVPKRGYRFIVPVSMEGAQKPGTEESLAPIATPSSPMPPAARAGDLGGDWVAFRNRRSILAIAAIAAAISLAAFFAFHRRRVQPSAFAEGKAVDIGSLGRSVAVLGFQNASGRPSDSWLATALAEMLRTELGAGGKLRVIPGENVAQFRAGAPWSQTDSLSQPTASRVGKALDSDLLVLGSFAAVGDQQSVNIRVDFRLQDAQTGQILYEGAESGTEKQFFGLVATVGSDLRERLGLPMISESEEASVVSSLPSDPDANRLYSLGLQKLRDADVAAAKDLFLQAEKLSPRFPLVHLMLSRAWGGLGYDQKAKREIRTAYDLSSSLSEVDRLQVEAAYYGSVLERDKAVSTYRALCALYPDSVDYAEQLVIALNAAGRHEEALAVIHNLRKLSPPASEDPRIDFWEGQLIGESNGAESRALLEKAAAGAASRGETLLYARFRLSECLDIVYSDHPQGATKLCKEAYDTFMAAGNHMYAADALRTMGDWRGAEGDMDGARELYKQALALLVPLGEHEKTGVVLNNMAIGYENQGQVAEAEKLFRQAADTWTECGDLEHAGAALGNLGDVLMLRGELHQAELQYQRAEKQIAVTNPNGVSYLLYSIANLHLYEGDLAAASRLASQALEMARRMNSTSDIASASEVIGTIQVSSGDLSGAEASFRQALNIFQKRGNQISIYEAEAALADVSLEQGKLSDAEQQLRKCVAQFRAQNSVLDEAQAETDLSRVLLAQGKLAGARQTVSDAMALSTSTADPNLKLPAAIMDARIQVIEIASRAKLAKTRANFSAPRRKLQDVFTTAHRLGYYGLECDARLALGQIELRENRSVVHQQLSTLAREAHQHGMELVARKAIALGASAAARSTRVASKLR